MTIKLGRMCKIHPTARLEAEELVIGDFSQIGENVRIHGARVEIGREAWIAPDVLIGGGRAEMGSLRTGDFLHLGMRSIVNIADDVRIGNEVGIGIDSKLYTHGAYLNQLEGFPYKVGPILIGNNVWVPNAVILPSVSIGNDVVIGAMSLVNKDIPSGCLAAGNPVKILKVDAYKNRLTAGEMYLVLHNIFNEVCRRVDDITLQADFIEVGRTAFIPLIGKIEGPVTKDTEIVKDVFRRHGIRFRYYNNGGIYHEWD